MCFCLRQSSLHVSLWILFSPQSLYHVENFHISCEGGVLFIFLTFFGKPVSYELLNVTPLSFGQVNDPERGFSVLGDGPLDMRMDPQVLALLPSVLCSYATKEITDVGCKKLKCSDAKK